MLKTWFEYWRVKLCRNDLKGNKNYFELAGGLSYRQFKLLRVKYSKCVKEIPGKLLILVRVSKGSNYMYQESTEGPSYVESFFATKFFQRYLIVGWLLNNTKNLPKSIGWSMKKISNKNFQLSPQETQFQENHQFRQKSDNWVF